MPGVGSDVPLGDWHRSRSRVVGAGLWLLTIIEEESLERKLGLPYIEYKKRVPGRILPGLPL